MTRHMWKGVVVLAAAAAAAACATPAPRTADSSPSDSGVRLPSRGAPGGDQEWDKSIIDQMGRDARRLAIADGCTNAGACRTAPLGVKACGGPREYIVYCATATDSAALFRKLDELARAERAYNERYGIMSTCEFRLAPDLALVGQTCRAVR